MPERTTSHKRIPPDFCEYIMIHPNGTIEAMKSSDEKKWKNEEEFKEMMAFNILMSNDLEIRRFSMMDIHSRLDIVQYSHFPSKCHSSNGDVDDNDKSINPYTTMQKYMDHWSIITMSEHIPPPTHKDDRLVKIEEIYHHSCIFIKSNGESFRENEFLLLKKRIEMLIVMYKKLLECFKNK